MLQACACGVVSATSHDGWCGPIVIVGCCLFAWMFAWISCWLLTKMRRRCHKTHWLPHSTSWLACHR